MSKLPRLEHRFVEFIPSPLEPGTIYVSMEYATASHLCCCGCGEKVVTPFSPTDWSLLFDGDTISLTPSIGNWGYKCRSHYWIREGRVVWAGSMSDEEIEAGRRADRTAKERYFADRVSKDAGVPARHSSASASHHAEPQPRRRGMWEAVKGWLRRS